MRSHDEIIKDGGGSSKVAQAIHPKLQEHVALPALKERVKAWRRDSSIPGEYWQALVDQGLASFAELARAAEARKFPEASALGAAA